MALLVHICHWQGPGQAGPANVEALAGITPSFPTSLSSPVLSAVLSKVSRCFPADCFYGVALGSALSCPISLRRSMQTMQLQRSHYYGNSDFTLGRLRVHRKGSPIGSVSLK